MAGRPLTRLKARYRLTPWWVKVVGVFALSRLVSTAILLWFARLQEANAWTGAHPDYFDFAKIWDGHWYYIVALAGYPEDLPITESGHVGENAWAFMPAYPAVVRATMSATGLPFEVAAVCVSVAFALGAALVFYRLMALVLPAETAMFSVVLFCVAPLSPILQVAYAESMQLFLLAVSLYLLLKRRYWLLLLPVAIASLTRPTGLAFALALGLHVAHRWWVRRREPFPPAERVAAVVATLFSAVMGFAWFLAAWAVTGSFTAYTDTELAWRAPYIGHQHLVPFTPWLQGANWWFQWFGLPAGAPLGGIAVVLAVALFALLMFTGPVRRLGIDLRLWVASYLLYLLAVFFPQSSTPRLLMPVFPLLGAIAQPRALWYRIGLVVVFVAGQIGWVHIAWWVDGYDWTPP